MPLEEITLFVFITVCLLVHIGMLFSKEMLGNIGWYVHTTQLCKELFSSWHLEAFQSSYLWLVSMYNIGITSPMDKLDIAEAKAGPDWFAFN